MTSTAMLLRRGAMQVGGTISSDHSKFEVVGRWVMQSLSGMYGMTKDDGIKRLAEVLETPRQRVFTGTDDTKFQVTSAAQYPKMASTYRLCMLTKHSRTSRTGCG